MSEAWIILGEPKRDGILLVCDHASNHIPGDIDLGLDADLLQTHIAWDIGVSGVADYLVSLTDCAAFMAHQSRLVVDLNRDAIDLSVIPESSDGHLIRGNCLDGLSRNARLNRYFYPYHERLELLLRTTRPALILSLHSFTPRLTSDPDGVRPWEIGILYNEQDVASQMAIAHLEGEGIAIGDQLPYSGKKLNATMNRHAEANEIPYVGIEIRQDLIADAAGQERFAALLGEMAQYVVERLASEAVS